MKTLKIGQELIVTNPVKVHFSNSSSSGYTELQVGTILIVTKQSEKSYTVAYREDITIAINLKENFIIPGFRHGRLKVEDLGSVTNLPTRWEEIVKFKELYKK